ncbi:unnamed protein product [Pleuronectes platessa]|uniref:Uncharacterized protein n=1 Tax=Pleuronectes platessa TaxID=8262 RepID=A0A9N7VSQ3_PLEPL|nr:unnamed protein product [Pleuronectes platessa]
MRLCSSHITLAFGSGGFTQRVSQTARVVSTRLWTRGVVREETVFCRALLPRHHICIALAQLGILASFTDDAGHIFYRPHSVQLKFRHTDSRLGALTPRPDDYLGGISPGPSAETHLGVRLCGGIQESTAAAAPCLAAPPDARLATTW